MWRRGRRRKEREKENEGGEKAIYRPGPTFVVVVAWSREKEENELVRAHTDSCGHHPAQEERRDAWCVCVWSRERSPLP